MKAENGCRLFEKNVLVFCMTLNIEGAGQNMLNVDFSVKMQNAELRMQEYSNLYK